MSRLPLVGFGPLAQEPATAHFGIINEVLPAWREPPGSVGNTWIGGIAMADDTANPPLSNPSGLCMCGCGQKTNIAAQSSRGVLKGQPRLFRPGHPGRPRAVTTNPNPSGLCMCGCDVPTPIAKKTNVARQRVKGHPVCFVTGHSFMATVAGRSLPSTKTCTRCGETLLATTSFFYPNSKSRSGLYAACKRCMKTEHLAYRRANPEPGRASARVHAHKRRAQKKGNGGMHTVDDVKAQYDRQKGRCFWCKKKVGNKYHVDHVIPLAKGGSNGPENIVVACPACNQSKRDQHPMDFAGVML